MSGERCSPYLLNQMWPDVAFLRAQYFYLKKEQDEQLLEHCWVCLGVKGCRAFRVSDAKGAQVAEKSTPGTCDISVIDLTQIPVFQMFLIR